MSEGSTHAAAPTGASGSVGTLPVTVYGGPGALDLLVPRGASAADVAREYAQASGLHDVPALTTRTGRPLPPGSSLASAGVRAGDILVAPSPPSTPHTAQARTRHAGRSREEPPAPLLWFLAGGALAVLAGVVGAGTGSSVLHAVTVDLLFAGAVIGVLPFGRFIDQRAVTAPAFFAAGTYAVVWESGAERLPITVGIAALAAAVGAAVGRAFGSGPRLVQNVWIIGGLTVFVVSALALLGGAPPPVTWSILLVLAMLAARSVPGLAVDVPDQMLVDLEKLAITAWSARDRPRGRRGRMLIRPDAVSDLLARGGHVVNAAAGAVLVVVAVAAPALLDTAVHDLDREGARFLLFFVGASVLLAARSYRHRPARVLLRAAGVIAWAWLAGALLTGAGSGALLWTVVGTLLLAAVVTVAAVATGRGWRSVWWARRAEVAETLVGVLGVASVVMASGLFRQIWELKSGG